jgi:protoheme IX farnesyltransferase
MIRDYLRLTKPGIVRGNVLAGFGGFMLASNGIINWTQMFFCMLGLALVIASGCVFNNYLDVEIDRKMSRTNKRGLVTNKISKQSAIVFGSILIVVGSVTLSLINMLAMSLAIFGFFAYVVIYGYFKRKSVYGTEAGSISGAIPPLVGYTAVSGRIDLAAIILFLIMIVWQMPHFYAIAIKRVKDYKAAGLPIISVERGIHYTKIRAIIYIFLFCLVAPLLTVFGYTGKVYIIVMLIMGLYWLLSAYLGVEQLSDKAWSGKVFGISLIVLLSFSSLISLNAWLP